MQWLFHFTERCLCSHFGTLTGIDKDIRLSEALLTKGRRILNFSQSQRLKWNKDIEHLPCDCSADNQLATTAILLLMNHFHEKEDSIFILADVIIISFLHVHSNITTQIKVFYLFQFQFVQRIISSSIHGILCHPYHYLAIQILVECKTPTGPVSKKHYKLQGILKNFCFVF